MVDKVSAYTDLTVEDAVVIFFASFYVFNIQYPAANALTLEFLQW